jgi:hypothetical protein
MNGEEASKGEDKKELCQMVYVISYDLKSPRIPSCYKT